MIFPYYKHIPSSIMIITIQKTAEQQPPERTALSGLPASHFIPQRRQISSGVPAPNNPRSNPHQPRSSNPRQPHPGLYVFLNISISGEPHPGQHTRSSRSAARSPKAAHHGHRNALSGISCPHFAHFISETSSTFRIKYPHRGYFSS